jgi:hypothetical protein
VIWAEPISRALAERRPGADVTSLFGVEADVARGTFLPMSCDQQHLLSGSFNAVTMLKPRWADATSRTLGTSDMQKAAHSERLRPRVLGEGSGSASDKFVPGARGSTGHRSSAIRCGWRVFCAASRRVSTLQ